MANTIATPIGQAFYPKLTTPDTKFNPDGVYSCKIMVSEEDYNSFRAQLQPLIEQEYSKHCIAKGKDKLPKANEPVKINVDGEYEINAKQVARTTTKSGEVLDFKVALYDADVKPITGDINIGSGSKIRMSVQPYFWFVPSQGFGYTLRLKAAQILELVEYDAGGHGFGKESGFTQGESFESVIVEDDNPEAINF
tara:strand:+ start:774 stop:1358 length:585 start_codon:yes stop_codon:yes gene_type:complete